MTSNKGLLIRCWYQIERGDPYLSSFLKYLNHKNQKLYNGKQKLAVTTPPFRRRFTKGQKRKNNKNKQTNKQKQKNVDKS